METISVIGLVGLAGSGKSRVAEHLILNHGYQLIKFAGPLKRMLRVLGLSKEEIEGDLKETPSDILMGKTPRWAMQSIGTEWGRNLIHEDIWAYAWKRRAADILLAGGKVVVDDCRFFNEAHYIKTFHPSEIWRIVRDSTVVQGDHQSETEQVRISVDQKIKNNSTIGNLKSTVDNLIMKH